MSMLPLVLLSSAIAFFCVDVLFGDEWVIWSNMLYKLNSGQFGIADLIAQQNEQRLLSTRVFGLMLDMPFGLNRMVACYLNVLLASVIFMLLVSLYTKTMNKMKIKNCNWPIIVIAFLIFSLMQRETFLVGINNSILLPLICLFSGLLLLIDKKMNTWRFLLVLFLGFAGSFHTASGLFFWICVLPPIYILEVSRKRKWSYFILCLITGTCSWLIYFTNYQSPPHHPSLFFMLSSPFQGLAYFFVLLGNCILSTSFLLPVTALIGISVFPILIATLIKFKKHKLLKQQPVVIWLSVAAYSLLTMISITIGRSGFGITHALQSRYVTHCNIFWIALLVLIVINQKLLPIREKEKIFFRLQLLFGRLCAGLFLFSTCVSGYYIYRRSEKLHQAREELFSLDEPDKLLSLFPVPNYLYAVLPVFFRKRQSIFRDIKHLSDYQYSRSKGGEVNSCKSVELEGCKGVMVTGTLDNKNVLVHNDVKYILITVNDKIIFACKPAADNSWKVFLPNYFFPAKTCSLLVYALSCKGEIAELKSNIASGIKLKDLDPPDYDLSKKFYCIDFLRQKKSSR